MPPKVLPPRFRVPTKYMPQLKGLLEKIDFLCSTCSSEYGRPMWRTLSQGKEAFLDPISCESWTPPTPSNPQGVRIPPLVPGTKIPYVTRVGVLCWACRTKPTDSEHPGFTQGICDLARFAAAYPNGYRRPKREVVNEEPENMEDEDESPVREKIPRKQFKKKKSEIGKA